MKKILSILLLALTVALTANAQDFLDDLRGKQKGKGTVSVSQSKEIDALLKGPSKNTTSTPKQTTTKQPVTTTSKQTTPKQPAATTPKQTTPKPTTTQPQHNAKSDSQGNVTDTPQDVEENAQKTSRTVKRPVINYTPTPTTTVDTRKKVMRKSYKQQGYRVQVFSGGNSRADKQKAYKAGAIIKRNFPDQPVYAHFKSPSWKCRMGNFLTQQDAQKFIPVLKKLGFSQACVVKDKIQVAY